MQRRKYAPLPFLDATLAEGFRGGGGRKDFADKRGRRPDKEHPRSPYVDTRRFAAQRAAETRKTTVVRRDSRKQLSNTIS